jgi:hypothetical protein
MVPQAHGFFFFFYLAVFGFFFKHLSSLQSPICEKSVKTEEKTHTNYSQMLFLRFFFNIFRNGTFKELGFFLRCNLCFKNLHLIYQTTL